MASGEIIVKWIATGDNVADLLTKSLDATKFNKFKHQAMNLPGSIDGPKIIEGNVLQTWAKHLGVNEGFSSFDEYIKAGGLTNQCMSCESGETDFSLACECPM